MMGVRRKEGSGISPEAQTQKSRVSTLAWCPPSVQAPSCLLLPPVFGTWVFQFVKIWEGQLSREQGREQGKSGVLFL